MTTKIKPTEADRQAAIALLERYGREVSTTPQYASRISRGEAIARALWMPLDADECVNLAVGVLEEWNFHTTTKAIGIITGTQGRGEFTAKGNQLIITFDKGTKVIIPD